VYAFDVAELSTLFKELTKLSLFVIVKDPEKQPTFKM